MPTVWAMPLGLVLAGVVSLLWLDLPIGRHYSETRLYGELERILDAAEHFGTP